MLASLLCIQHRQISGTLPSPFFGGSFDRTDDCINDELLFDCRDNEQNEVASVIKKHKKEARKLVKDKEKVKSYISVIAAADRVPEEMQRLKDVVTGGGLVDRLKDQYCDPDVTLLFIVQCYLYYCEWKQQNEDDAILLLLLS